MQRPSADAVGGHTINVRALAARRLLRSAQDISDGGLAVALAECAMLGGVGATIEIQDRPEVALFSEDQGRAVVGCRPEDVLYVGDSFEKDVVGARAAGLRSAWLTGAAAPMCRAPELVDVWLRRLADLEALVT